MLKNQEGNYVPNATFPVMINGQWQKVTTDELFKNQNVIVFSLPGAFTPTCSSSHVPRFNELAPVFKKNGIDRIICVSVNDTFVMNAWAKDQHADNIDFLPDGNGEFTEGMGMLVDKQDLGFGKRSWRYSMFVKDRKIEKMFIEPEVEGDPFEVSDADTMMDYLNIGKELPKDISIITKPGCPHCANAKQLLKDKGYSFEEIELGDEATTRSLRAISGEQTVPQVFINGQHIGGFDQLKAHFSS
jgi:glutaredoxin-like protein